MANGLTAILPANNKSPPQPVLVSRAHNRHQKKSYNLSNCSPYLEPFNVEGIEFFKEDNIEGMCIR